MKRDSGSWKVPLVLLTTGILLFLAIQNVQEKSRFDRLDDGVFWEAQRGRVVAKRVDTDGPGSAAGLQVGDVLVLVGDEPIEGPDDVRAALDRASKGASLTYQIVREQAQRALSLEVAPHPTGNVPVYYFLAAVGIFSLLVGTVVYVRRRGVAATAHFYVLCVFWFLMFGFSHTGELNGWDRAYYWMDQAGQFFFPPIFLHFALCFPARQRLVRSHPWVLWVMYLPSVALVYLALAAEFAFFSPLEWGDSAFVGTHNVLNRIVPAFVAAMSLFAFAAFVTSHRRARSITVKKQTKWIVWGTGFGTLPFALFYAVPYLFGIEAGPTMDLSVVPLALIPLSFAYAIVKYRLMDVEVLFKRGMVFTLATAIVGGLYLAIFVASAQYLVGDQHSTILALLSAMVVVLLFTPIKSRIQNGIDRLFYRERYDYRRALLAFSRDLNAHLDLDHLSSRLVQRIADTFEVEKVALLVSSSERELRLQAGHGLSSEERDNIGLSVDTPLYARLSNGEAIYYGEFDWNPGRNVQKADAQDRLSIEDLQYAIPCRSHDKVVGVILLGRRWDQSALSSEDMDLLDMLSGQAATALQNARLYSSLERKAAEFEALKEHSENTIESLEAGIVVLDLSGTIVRCNRALESLYGLSRAEAIGKTFEEVFPESMRQALVASRGEDWWMVGDASGVSRLNLKNLEGEDKVVRLQVAPFVAEGANGSGSASSENLQGTVVIFEDITTRVELETQLQLREKMASLGLLAAGVAHEVNTPLTGISSFTQMLQDQTTHDDPKAKLLDKIERQTERASKIVNNLLNFARQGRSHFVPVALDDVIRDVLSLLEHQLTRAHIQVRLELEEDLPHVMGDENKLQQVFLNLILNAQDAMPSGGWLTLTTVATADDVVATVSDTGQGITKEDVKRIYDPFFTTKRAGSSGTGLGLSITYGIVQEHSGSINVESSLGQGTSFSVRLSKAADEKDTGLRHARPSR